MKGTGMSDVKKWELPQEDRDALKAALEAHKADRVANPQIPLDADIDGDGIADAWALDENGDVVLVPQVAIADTVFAATGEDGE
jgi:hypothetical protein